MKLGRADHDLAQGIKSAENKPGQRTKAKAQQRCRADRKYHFAGKKHFTAAIDSRLFRGNTVSLSDRKGRLSWRPYFGRRSSVGRSISSYVGTWVLSDHDSNAAPQTVQTASPTEPRTSLPCVCTRRRNCIEQLSPSREYALRTFDFPARNAATIKLTHYRFLRKQNNWLPLGSAL